MIGFVRNTRAGTATKRKPKPSSPFSAFMFLVVCALAAVSALKLAARFGSDTDEPQDTTPSHLLAETYKGGLHPVFALLPDRFMPRAMSFVRWFVPGVQQVDIAWPERWEIDPVRVKCMLVEHFHDEYGRAGANDRARMLLSTGRRLDIPEVWQEELDAQLAAHEERERHRRGRPTMRFTSLCLTL